jgi:hypothetical protein
MDLAGYFPSSQRERPFIAALGHFNFINMDIRPQLAPGSVVQMGKLSLSGFPQFIGGTPQRPREQSDSDRRESGDSNAQRIKNFADLNDEEWHQAIGGAGFLAGLCAFFAYLAVRRD